MMLIMMIGFSHIVGDSDALLDVDGDALLLIDILANLTMMVDDDDEEDEDDI